MYKVLISLLIQESALPFSNLCNEDYTQQTFLKANIRVLLMTGGFGETHMFCIVFFLRIMMYLLLQHWEFCLLTQGLCHHSACQQHICFLFSVIQVNAGLLVSTLPVKSSGTDFFPPHFKEGI